MKSVRINFILDPHFTPHIPESRKDNYPESIKKKYMLVNELYPSDFNILAGDVFHKATLPLRFINDVSRFESESQRGDGHQTYAVYGNHDCLYSDPSYVKDSSLGNWLATGLVKELNELEIPWRDGVIRIVGWKFNEPPPRKGDVGDKCYTILVGHAFYETAPVEEKELLLTKDQVLELGYNFIVLGHDHSKYHPVEFSNGSILYRPGSLSRGTSHFHNVWREVSILRMEFKESGVVEAKYVDIPSLPPEECFAGEKRDGKQREFKATMGAFVKAMLAAKVQSDEVFEILDQLQADKSLKDYVESLLFAYGMARTKKV